MFHTPGRKNVQKTDKKKKELWENRWRNLATTQAVDGGVTSGSRQNVACLVYNLKRGFTHIYFMSLN